MSIPTYGDKKVWKEESQPFEINWWRENWSLNKIRNQEFIDKMKNEFGFTEDSFAGKTILDIGAGPRSWPSLLLNKAKIIIVEPLAYEFVTFNDGYYKLPNITKVYSLPGEECVEELINNIDIVWCFNTLNHCYEWKKVIDNIEKYLKSNGKLYMKVRVAESPHNGHVGVKHDEFLEYLHNSKLYGRIYPDSVDSTNCYLVEGTKKP